MESTKKYFLLSILLLLFYVRIAEASIFIDKSKDFKKSFSSVSEQLATIIYSTDPNGNTIQYTYDTLNRLTQKTYPDASTTTYQYDAIGNLTSASNAYISYTFAYDALGRMISVTDSLGKSISYIFDANSNRTSMTSPTGTTSYTYNALNQLTQLVQGTQAFTFTYDTLGRRTSFTMPNGTTTSYSYDSLSRLTSLSTLNSSLLTINSNTYTYDNVGNKLSKQDTVGTYNYTYDNTYQLIQTIYPPEAGKPNEAFSYDPVGNRTNTTVDAANKLLQDSNAVYQYDNNGNRYIKTQTDGTITYYSYDYDGRLTRVETQKPNGTTIAIYKYDPLGRRIEKSVTENSVTTTTRYLYDGMNIIAEYDENNTMKAQYIQNLGIDDQLAMVKNGQAYYYHKDGLGSVVALTDNDGNVVQKYEYDSFGNITSNLNPNFIQPFTFTGREYDPESGLYYLRARELDSKTGTFTQKDPIGFAGGDVNLYRYVGNNPVNFVDPLGLDGYMCTKPLDVLGGKGTKSGPDISVNPAYHQYLCVELSTITVCGGQSKKDYSGLRELWPWGEGAPSDDHFDANRCKKVSDDKCIDKCLLNAFYEKTRPKYGLAIVGTNCQEWANNALAQCQKKCKEKK